MHANKLELSRTRVLTLSLLLIILIVAGYACVKVLMVRRPAMSALAGLRRLEAMAEGDPADMLLGAGLAPVQAELSGLHADLAAIQRHVGGDLALLAHLGWLPYAGPNLAAAPHLLQIGVELTTAGEAALDGAGGMLASLLESPALTTDAATQQILAGLLERQSAWARAQAATARASEARDRFDADGLHPRIAEMVTMLDAYLPWLQAGTTAAVLAPELMGASGPRRYLILAQNNDELRATGGYISGIGLLVLDQGKIAELSFEDSYAVDNLRKDHPDAPEAMREQMRIELWMLRDANWYPDFGHSAQAAIQLYYIDRETDIDGVIAADMTALQRIVGAAGPLDMPEYDTRVDGDNVLETIASYWAPSLPEGMTWEQWEAIPWEIRKREWFDNRKDFMPDLIQALQDRITSDPGSLDLAKLLFTTKEILDEKHVLIYLPDPQARNVLRDLNWDGAVIHPPHDYLAVVDANVGYTKANPNIAETISYRVEIDADGRATSQVQISYENRSTRKLDVCVKDMSYDLTYELMQQRCYWDYVRVYAPGGAVLGESQGTSRVDELDEGTGHTIWATSFVIAPGQQHQIGYAYVLPEETVVQDGLWTYKLAVQKQAGTNAVPLEVEVRLPEGAKVESIVPRPTRVEDGKIRFKTNLKVDRWIEIVYAR